MFPKAMDELQNISVTALNPESPVCNARQRAFSMTSKRAQGVYGSQAAALLPARKARRSQSFGGNDSNILNSSRLSITQNLSLFGKMTKNELQLKLHETLCDKDKLTE